MNYRQVHIDFHTSEYIGEIGKEFDKKQFQEALKLGHVSSVTLFSKCHHGWSYHPTKTNEILYQRDAKITCDTSSNTKVGGLGLVGALINATADAVKTAVTDYVDVAIMCNRSALVDIPYGKYHPDCGNDGEGAAYPVKFNISASK